MLSRRSLLLAGTLLAAILLWGCSGSKAPAPDSVSRPTEPTKAAEPAKTAETTSQGKAAEPTKAAEPVKPSVRVKATLPAPRESTPTAFETALESMLKAMAEGNWDEAQQYIAAEDPKPEVTAARYKSILNAYYKGDPAKIPTTRVLLVNLDGERAELQISTSVLTARVKATYLYRDGHWYLIRLGDTELQ